MADTIRYVDTDVVGGLGDGTSLANAYSGINAWNTAEAAAVGTGDRHLCYLSGTALDVATSSLDLAGWSGAGELHLIGDSPDEPFEVDTTAYRYEPEANDASFVLSNSVDKIVISNFQQVYGANSYTEGAYRWISGETIGNVDFIHCVVDYTLGTKTTKTMFNIDGTGSVGGKAFNRDNCLMIGSAKEDINNSYRQDLTINSTNCTFSGDFTTRLTYTNQASSAVNYTNCAIESSVLMASGNSPVTYTNCATNTGVGTSPVTITSWSTAFADKAGGDYTPAGTLIGAGTGGLNIGTVESGGAAGDTTPPVITRVGADPATFVSGNAGTYTDAGFTALDDTDGDITANIAITGLPTDFIGAHTVRANVSDAALNAATEVTRTVNVTTPAGYAFIELVSPDLIDDAKLLFGLTGDAAVTGDQLVAESPSTQGLAYTLEADGGITWSVAPTVTQTIDRYVIKADGTVGTAAIFTYTVAGTSTAPIMPATATRNVAQPNQLMGVYATSNTPDPAVTYTLTGTDAGLLSINGSTGAVTANSPTSVAGKSSYSFNVVATNIAGTDTTAVTVTIVLVVARNMTEWIEANGAGGQTNEAWLKYMLGAGASGKTFNDLMFDWLGILGYTGSLTERVAKWNEANLG